MPTCGNFVSKLCADNVLLAPFKSTRTIPENVLECELLFSVYKGGYVMASWMPDIINWFVVILVFLARCAAGANVGGIKNGTLNFIIFG